MSENILVGDGGGYIDTCRGEGTMSFDCVSMTYDHLPEEWVEPAKYGSPECGDLPGRVTADAWRVCASLGDLSSNPA